MITIAGRQLAGRILVDVNPLDYPVRTFLFAIPAILFTFYSLQLFRNVEKGVTLALPKSGFPLPKIWRGKVKPGVKFKLNHYDPPLLTGLLGLLFFSAAEFFLVIMFKAFHYSFI